MMKDQQTMPQEPIRVKIIIDGANFHHGLQRFNSKYQDFHIDFKSLGHHLAQNRILVGINYYTIEYPRSKNKAMHTKHKIFFSRLKADGIIVKKFKISSSNNKIKGDDIKLALDLVVDGINDKYDIGILVSGDGDFIPAVRYVHEYHKKVELWGFPSSCSRRLENACDFHFSFTRSKLRKFYRP